MRGRNELAPYLCTVEVSLPDYYNTSLVVRFVAVRVKGCAFGGVGKGSGDVKTVDVTPADGNKKFWRGQKAGRGVNEEEGHWKRLGNYKDGGCGEKIARGDEINNALEDDSLVFFFRSVDTAGIFKTHANKWGRTFSFQTSSASSSESTIGKSFSDCSVRSDP